jgi:hypothetical protein
MPCLLKWPELSDAVAIVIGRLLCPSVTVIAELFYRLMTSQQFSGRMIAIDQALQPAMIEPTSSSSVYNKFHTLVF